MCLHPHKYTNERVPNVEQAEARAIRLGLKAAARRGVMNALILSDCITLVKNLCSGASDLLMGARSVTVDILDGTKSIDYCKFSHISRSLNCTADSLARAGRSLPTHMCLDQAEAWATPMWTFVMFCMGHTHD